MTADKAGGPEANPVREQQNGEQYQGDENEEGLAGEGVVSAEEVESMKKAVAQRLSADYDAVQNKAERFELQELSAVPFEDIGNFCPRTAVNQQVIERVFGRKPDTLN